MGQPDEGEFVIAQILRARKVITRRKKGVKKTPPKFEYLVRWLGYSIEESTWEPPDHLPNDLSQRAHSIVVEKKERVNLKNRMKGAVPDHPDYRVISEWIVNLDVENDESGTPMSREVTPSPRNASVLPTSAPPITPSATFPPLRAKLEPGAKNTQDSRAEPSMTTSGGSASLVAVDMDEKQTCNSGGPGTVPADQQSNSPGASSQQLQTENATRPQRKRARNLAHESMQDVGLRKRIRALKQTISFKIGGNLSSKLCILPSQAFPTFLFKPANSEIESLTTPPGARGQIGRSSTELRGKGAILAPHLLRPAQSSPPRAAKPPFRQIIVPVHSHTGQSQPNLQPPQPQPQPQSQPQPQEPQLQLQPQPQPQPRRKRSQEVVGEEMVRSKSSKSRSRPILGAQVGWSGVAGLKPGRFAVGGSAGGNGAGMASVAGVTPRLPASLPRNLPVQATASSKSVHLIHSIPSPNPMSIPIRMSTRTQTPNPSNATPKGPHAIPLVPAFPPLPTLPTLPSIPTIKTPRIPSLPKPPGPNPDPTAGPLPCPGQATTLLESASELSSADTSQRFSKAPQVHAERKSRFLVVVPPLLLLVPFKPNRMIGDMISEVCGRIQRHVLYPLLINNATISNPNPNPNLNPNSNPNLNPNSNPNPNPNADANPNANHNAKPNPNSNANQPKRRLGISSLSLRKNGAPLDALAHIQTAIPNPKDRPRDTYLYAKLVVLD